jgi:hypothetical protein
MASFMFLGNAGFELTCRDRVYMFDPFVSRRAFSGNPFKPVVHDTQRIRECLPRCDHVFITHSHIDHVIDVPRLLALTNANAFGSTNTCAILDIHGVEENKRVEIHAGSTLTFEGVTVEVLEGDHPKFLGLYSCAGAVSKKAIPPLMVWQYAMDTCFSFLITVDGIRLMVHNSEKRLDYPPADILLFKAHHGRSYTERTLAAVKPRVVVPYHYEIIFAGMPGWLHHVKQFVAPLVPLLKEDKAGLLRRRIEQYDKSIKMFMPEAFVSYDILDIIS